MDKKTLRFLSIFLLLLLPALTLMFSNQLYFGYDVLTHIGRINEFHAAVLNGQIPPRLAPTIVHGNGYPLFVVNYQLPYYFTEFLMVIKNDSVSAFKAVMSITYLLSGVFAFLLFRKIGSNLASMTGAIVFSYLPYRFANLYSRGSIGESVSLMFVPLIFLFMHNIIEKRRFSIPLLALSIFGLITSHSVIFIIFVPVFVAYAVIILKIDKKTLLHLIIVSILGFTLSSFQLLPSIFERKFLFFDKTLLDIYSGQFVNIFQIFRIPIQGVNVGTSFQAGIISLVVLAAAFGLFIYKRQLRVLLFLAFSLMATYFITQYSKWFWDNITILPYIIYPWRFISIIIISVSFLSVYIIDFFKSKNLKIIIVLLLIFGSIYTSRHYYLKTEHSEPLLPRETLTAFDESTPVWSSKKTFKDGPLILSTNNINVSGLEEKPFRISFGIMTENTSDITIRRMYFPGWTLEVNGEPYPLGNTDGFLSTKLKAGTWKVDVYFVETPLRRTANAISLVSLIIIIGLFVGELRNHKHRYNT